MKKFYKKEMLLDTVTQELKKTKKKAQKKYEYLSNIVGTNTFQAAYISAQARELLAINRRIKNTPFKALLAEFNKLLTPEILYNTFYIKYNEFGELELDTDRIEALIIEPLKAEERRDI